MRIKNITTQLGLFAMVLGLGLVAMNQTALAREMTAFELAREGNRCIGEQSKDKVVQIRSEKSAGSLNPNLW